MRHTRTRPTSRTSRIYPTSCIRQYPPIQHLTTYVSRPAVPATRLTVSAETHCGPALAATACVFCYTRLLAPAFASTRDLRSQTVTVRDLHPVPRQRGGPHYWNPALRADSDWRRLRRLRDRELLRRPRHVELVEGERRRECPSGLTSVSTLLVFVVWHLSLDDSLPLGVWYLDMFVLLMTASIA